MPLLDLVFGTEEFKIPTSKDEQREALKRDVQAFLDRGGKIKTVPVTFRDYVPKFVVAKNV